MNADHSLRFEFGRNWKDYIAQAGEAEIESAVKGLGELLGNASLEGASFLDIGCGSGLMSLAAIRLGASRVTGIDFDENSVQASRILRERFPELHQRWTVVQGSILDRDFLGQLGRFDMIYSWGVLHHTGDMYEAFKNISDMIELDGLLMIAIYNRTPTSRFWFHYKRLYNLLAEPFRTVMVFGVFAPRAIVRLVRGRHPLKDNRGMNVWYDARDWAGGYPYEYASVDEVRAFFEPRGYSLEVLKPTSLTGCNEFAFRRTAQTQVLTPLP